MAERDAPIHFLVGLECSTGKFLNVEKFNNQFDATAPALKQKQTFVVEIVDGLFYFKSWTGNYLASDELGKITVANKSRGKDEGFAVEFAEGPVFIRTAYGKYLTPDGQTISGSAKARTDAERINIHFASHPQVCLRQYEGRYLLIDDNAAAVSPNHFQMGIGTMFTLVYANEGRYALWSGINGKFLSVMPDGDLSASANSATPDACFIFEWVEDKLAIKSLSAGKYLTIEGARGAVKAKRPNVGQREKWELLDSHAQVTLRAFNNKFIGTQQATVICQQDEAGLAETFIMETEGERVSLRNSHAHFVTYANGTLKADAPERNDTTLWTVVYPALGRVGFRSVEGKYLASKAIGGVFLKGEDGNDTSFTLQLLNRPVIALKSSFNTFVGTMNGRLVTHKATVETFSVEFENGLYAFRTAAGQYFSTADGNVVPGQRELFEIRFQGYSRFAIRTQNGHYLAAEQHGGFIAKSGEIGANELFEF